MCRGWGETSLSPTQALSSNGTQPSHQDALQAAQELLNASSPVDAAFKLIQTEAQRQELLALLMSSSQDAGVAEPA